MNLNRSQKIVVSGSSSGIGRKACMHFLDNGYQVYGISRTRCDYKHQNFYQIQQDLTDITGLGKSLEIIGKGSEVITLINCAGATFPSTSLPSLEQIKKTFDVNFFGTYNLIYEMVPYLKNSSCPSIINIASIAGLTGFPGNPGYGASKAAIINLTKNLAIDLAKFNIRVNSISPGYFRTKMTERSYQDPNLRKIREKNIILQRYGEIEELMGILSYLVSSDSVYVTGQNFVIDGGWTAKGFVE